MPVIDGYINKTTVCKNKVAGRKMTTAMAKLMSGLSNKQFDQSNEQEFIKEIKEANC